MLGFLGLFLNLQGFGLTSGLGLDRDEDIFVFFSIGIQRHWLRLSGYSLINFSEILLEFFLENRTLNYYRIFLLE